jgi:hypothetical protein
MNDLLNFLSFQEALIIAISVFFTDWVAGVVAALRSGRHLKSSIMRESISTKVINYFHFFLIGLAFYFAAIIGDYQESLSKLAVVIVLIPAVPEILSIFENIKIARTQIDTKPKEDSDDDNKTDSSRQE